MRYKRVGVLLGGMSAEREVSLKSGQAVAAGLSRAGYDVVEVDAQRDLCRRLTDAEVEAVYIALHGRFGEDGTVQGMLEMMGIPYTGSSLLVSALVMDKEITRTLLATASLPIPQGFTLIKNQPAELPAGWQVPVVVKPANEGSSVGITIVRKESEFAGAVQNALAHSDRALVEKFVSGAEVTVSVLDGEVLGALEIEPHSDFYDYSAKYDEGGSTHHVPPRLPQDRVDESLDLAKRAYQILGCSGAARVDLIVPEDARTVILEANTIPGMTEMSLLPEIAAKAAGISFDELVSRIIEGAALHVS